MLEKNKIRKMMYKVYENSHDTIKQWEFYETKECK